MKLHIPIALVALGLLSAAATAQQTTLAAKGEIIATIRSLENGGAVLIDWPATEREAANVNGPNNAIARLMLAIRDGTWQPREVFTK